MPDIAPETSSARGHGNVVSSDDEHSPSNTLPENHEVDSETMAVYYQRLFPFKQFFQWLNHSPAPQTDFTNREIAFTLENGAYLRYQSFKTGEAFRRDVLRLNPSRFEIGPVYSHNPREKKLHGRNFAPLSKELVFDIDLTDYDSVRTCCSGTQICNRCWQFITLAIKILDTALRDDFGFQHILWVYSGRRGAHAWVCDKRARLLNDQKRSAVASYLQIIGKGDKGKLVNIRRPFHPHVSRSFDLAKKEFASTILSDQDPWMEDSDKLLNLLPDKVLVEALRRKWASLPGRSSTLKWQDIDDEAKKGTSKTLKSSTLLESKQDIILELQYPRLDIEVSKHLNHLLKSPFCVHPGTGRVCVPIDISKVDSFDPFEVPTVNQLLEQINNYQAPDSGSSERIHDIEKTSLLSYATYFRRFVSGLVKEEYSNKRSREEDDEVNLEF
jgi:DNA primase small subunit